MAYNACLFGFAIEVQDPRARRVRAPRGFSRNLALRDHSGRDDHSDPTLANPWILAHILSIFLGEAFFAISCLAGAIYIFQENQLKSKRIGTHLKKLPSLITLDRINHLSLLLGFPLLTVSLVIGFILAREIWSEGWIWGAKETWSTVTWLLYAFLINGRLSLGWRGRRAALGAVIGFCIVVVTFAMGYIFPGQHRFE